MEEKVEKEYIGYGLCAYKNKNGVIKYWTLTFRGHQKIARKEYKGTLNEIFNEIGSPSIKSQEKTILLIHCKTFILHKVINATFCQQLQKRWSQQEFEFLKEKAIKKMKTDEPNEHGFCKEYSNPGHAIYTIIKVNKGARYFSNSSTNYTINNGLTSNKNAMKQSSKSLQMVHQQNPYYHQTAYAQQQQQQYLHHVPSYYNGQFRIIPPMPTMFQMQIPGLSPFMSPYNMQQALLSPYNQAMMHQINQIPGINRQPVINNITINNNITTSPNHQHVPNPDNKTIIKELKELKQQNIHMQQTLDGVTQDIDQIKKTTARGINFINKIFETANNTQEMMQDLIHNEATKVAAIGELVANVDTLKLCLNNMTIKSKGLDEIEKIKRKSLPNICMTVKEAAEAGDNLAKETIENLKNIQYLSAVESKPLRRQLGNHQYFIKGSGGCPRPFPKVKINIDPSKIAIQNGGNICVPVILMTHLNILNKNGQEIISKHIEKQSIVKFRKFVVPYHDLRLYHPLSITDGDKQQYLGIKEIYCHGITAVNQSINRLKGLNSLISQDNTKNNAYIIIIKDSSITYSHIAVIYPFKFIEKYDLVKESERKESMMLFVSCDINVGNSISAICKQIWIECLTEEEQYTQWYSYIGNCYVSHVYRLCLSDKKEDVMFYRPIMPINDNDENNDNVVSESGHKMGDYILVSIHDDENEEGLQVWPAQIQTIRFLDLSKLKDDVDDDEDIDVRHNQIINESLKTFVKKPLCLYKVRYLQLVSEHNVDLSLENHDEWVLDQQCFPFKEIDLKTNGLEISMNFPVGSFTATNSSNNSTSISRIDDVDLRDKKINTKKRKLEKENINSSNKKRRM